MKTPLQKLLEYESDLTNMFDSDTRVAMALLYYIRTNRKKMLDEEHQCKYIKRAGESCTLNNNCKYPNCK
jgi:hypothetical protein